MQNKNLWKAYHMSQKISSFNNPAYLGQFAFNNWTLDKKNQETAFPQMNQQHKLKPGEKKWYFIQTF